jgi:hypothetical protein
MRSERHTPNRIKGFPIPRSGTDIAPATDQLLALDELFEIAESLLETLGVHAPCD